MKPINSQCQIVRFGKFAEKLTATQLMLSIIRNVKCVTKNKHKLRKQKKAIQRDLKLE